MKVKAVIFDVGGVLHSSEGEYVEKDIISTLGITRKQYNESKKELIELLRLGKITEDEFWQRLIFATNAPNPLPAVSLLGREFDRRYSVFTDVLEIVRALKEQGITVAILSNTNETHANINQSHGVYDLFDMKILSYEVGLAKPDVRIYELALERLRVLPAETIFIDDKKENVDAARALGIHGIQFQSAGQLTGELESRGIPM